MERALVPDVALVKAWKADKAATCLPQDGAQLQPAVRRWPARETVVEVEEIVAHRRAFDPTRAEIHLPGIYVHRIVQRIRPKSASSSAPPNKVPRRQEA